MGKVVAMSAKDKEILVGYLTDAGLRSQAEAEKVDSWYVEGEEIFEAVGGTPLGEEGFLVDEPSLVEGLESEGFPWSLFLP